MKFWVEVTRTSYARQTLAIEADSVEQAETLAMNSAPEGEFSTYDNEYEVTSCEAAKS
jgi:hypothetical protein